MNVVLDVDALVDLERIVDHHLKHSGEARAHAQVRLIKSAIDVLAEHPRIGRPVEGSTLRELVISVARSGYVALYDFDEAEELVRVVGVRHQKEAGYRGR